MPMMRDDDGEATAHEASISKFPAMLRFRPYIDISMMATRLQSPSVCSMAPQDISLPLRW